MLERWPCDVVRCGGRSGLLRTRSLDLQILILISNRLEDDTSFAVSKVIQRHSLQKGILHGDFQLELIAFADDTTEREALEGELTVLQTEAKGLLCATNDRDQCSLSVFDLDLGGVASSRRR